MIKTARQERNLTQEELGRLIGVQKAQISKLESSANSATIDTIIRVFKALKAEINFNVKLEDNFVKLAWKKWKPNAQQPFWESGITSFNEPVNLLFPFIFFITFTSFSSAFSKRRNVTCYVKKTTVQNNNDTFWRTESLALQTK